MNYKIKRKIEKSLDKDDQIKETFYNNLRNVTLTKKGYLIYWNKKKIRNVTQLKDELSDDEYIIQLEEGDWGYMVLTNKQKIYTWEYNFHTEISSILKHKQIKNRKGEHQLITQIGVGKDHFIVLTKKGEVYSWGENKYGQCGTGDTNKVHHPIKIQFSEILSKYDSIKQISTSVNFNVALTSNGQVYCWGRNDCGQCGSSGTILSIYKKPCEALFFKREMALIDTLFGMQGIAFTIENSCYIWGRIRVGRRWKRRLPSKSLYPLHKALSFKKTDLARQMMTPKNIHELDDAGQSPLYIACSYGLEEMVKEILQKKITPIKKMSKSNNEISPKLPLDVASSKGYLEIVKLLMDHKSKGSKEAIFNAISEGYNDIVKLLLDYQDDLWYVKDSYQNTVLCRACRAQSVDIVKFLLSKRVGVDDQNKNGETPLIIACNYPAFFRKHTLVKNPDITTDFLTIASMLLENQANVHIKNMDGLTPAMLATHHCQFTLLNLLLTYEPQLVHDYSLDYGSLLHLLFRQTVYTFF